MADIRAGDLRITGGIRAGNWRFGKVVITPVANTPTSTTVSGFTLAGTGTVHGYCTTVSSVPGTDVQETTVTSVAATGMTVWIFRDNTTVTEVDWMMWRKRV